MNLYHLEDVQGQHITNLARSGAYKVVILDVFYIQNLDCYSNGESVLLHRRYMDAIMKVASLRESHANAFISLRRCPRITYHKSSPVRGL